MVSAVPSNGHTHVGWKRVAVGQRLGAGMADMMHNWTESRGQAATVIGILGLNQNRVGVWLQVRHTSQRHIRRGALPTGYS